MYLSRGVRPVKSPVETEKLPPKREFALAAPDGVLVEHRRGLVPVHGPEVVHALPVEPEAALCSGHRIVLFIERFLLLRPGLQDVRAPAWLAPYHNTGDRVKIPSTRARYFRAFVGELDERGARRLRGSSTTGAAKSSRAVSPSRRRSIPSGSMPVIRQSRAAAAEQTRARNRRSRRRDPRSCACRISGSAAASAAGVGRKQQIAAFDPVDPAEAGDEMAAFDRDPIEMEIGKAGIDGARRVVRGEAREAARVVDRLGLPDHGQARPGQRVGVARGGVEQQRDPRVEGDIAAVLREIGQQQKRARIEIGGEQDQRRVGRAAQAGGERGALAAARSSRRPDSRRIAVRSRFRSFRE